MLKIFELAPWILTIMAVAKNMISPAFLIMPMAVKEGGTVITMVVTVLILLTVLHGALISSALKNYIGASKGKSVETILLADACEKMGARGPDFLRVGGLHVANLIRLSEFLTHIFRCSFYINVIVDILETMSIFENFPNALLVLIITMAAVLLAPIAHIWQLRFILSTLAAVIVAVVLVFVFSEASGKTVDEELVDKRGDPQYIPFCVGKILFMLTYFTPHLNSDFRQPSLSYIPPYVVGLVLHTVLGTLIGIHFYRAYTEETQTLIFFNLKNDTSMVYQLVVAAMCLAYLPEVAHAVGAFQFNFTKWKNLMCFPKAPQLVIKIVIYMSVALLPGIISIMLPSVSSLTALAGASVGLLSASILPSIGFILKVLSMKFANQSIKMLMVILNMIICIIAISVIIVVSIKIVVYVFQNYDVLVIS